MNDLTKHYKVYPDKSQPNHFIIDIYEEVDGTHTFERMTTDLANLSTIIRKFEQEGYAADYIQFDSY